MRWLLIINTSLCALSYEGAKEQVLLHPMVQRSAGSVDARYYLYQQSQAFPNPELTVYAQGLGRKGDCCANDEQEITYSLSQLIELGGKRGIRKCLAAFEWQRAQLKHEIEKKIFLFNFSKIFFNASYFEERHKLALEKGVLFEEREKLLGEKVKIGKARDFDLRKLSVNRKLHDLEIKKRAHDFEINLKRLQDYVGDCVTSCDGALLDCNRDIECDEIDSHPALELIKVEREILFREYEYQRAQRIPDVVITGGYNATLDHKESGAVVGINIPIPIADQNCGNIYAASVEVERKDWEYEATRRFLEVKKASILNKISIAREGEKSLSEDILKETNSQVSQLDKGEVDKLELIDAKLNEIDLRELYLDQLKTLHEGLFELEYLFLEDNI